HGREPTVPELLDQAERAEAPLALGALDEAPDGWMKARVGGSAHARPLRGPAPADKSAPVHDVQGHARNAHSFAQPRPRTRVAAARRAWYAACNLAGPPLPTIQRDCRPRTRHDERRRPGYGGEVE